MNLAIVYPYLDHAARGDELRWSLRSLGNIRGAVVYPVVVGRPPEWYQGSSIAVTENGSRESDVQSKLLSACWSDAVTERFLAVSDDTVFSKPIDVNELLTFRCRGSGNYTELDIARIGGTTWHELRRKTLEECLRRGWETRDSSTHWPWAFEKSKLLRLMGEIEAKVGSYLVEILYRNRFEAPYTHDNSGFAYVRKTGDFKYWKSLLESNQVVNWSDAVFDVELKNALLEHFPQSSPWEKTGADSVTIDQLADKIIVARQSCLHLQEPVRFERSIFDGKMMPVFGCQLHGECVLERINTKPHRRCIACPDRSLTNRFVEITRPSSLATAKPQVNDMVRPGLAEAQAAAGELNCRHREGIAYTVSAGSRPCVKRDVTVWNCAKHGECTLRFESCLNGKVRGCSTCPDLSPPTLVQINADQNNPQG